MVDHVSTAVVRIWGRDVGAVTWLADKGYAAFEYDPAFRRSGWLDLSPIHMPFSTSGSVYQFPTLNPDTFEGLPGLLADCLPDKFGNAIIDAWLARSGRDIASFSPVERLCYIGSRGMGALEFAPALSTGMDQSVPIEIAGLVELTQHVLQERGAFQTRIAGSEADNEDAIKDILRVGTSAGGARAKAVIAMNAAGDIRSGQVQAPEGYDYWILKFDGVTDMELGRSKEFGRIEYAYYLMAKAAGIDMSESRLLKEGGRAHFLTKRFDRDAGKRLHMQTLCGIAHYDYNMAGIYSYEQAFSVMRQLRLSKAEASQQFKRMVFNIIARNQDDHTKNMTFIMGPDGKWRLSPAYDLTYAHNPHGQWTNQHQMSLGGKRDGFTRDDLIAAGESISLPKPGQTIDEVLDAVHRWREFADVAGVDIKITDRIASSHRLDIGD